MTTTKQNEIADIIKSLGLNIEHGAARGLIREVRKKHPRRQFTIAGL